MLRVRLKKIPSQVLTVVERPTLNIKQSFFYINPYHSHNHFPCLSRIHLVTISVESPPCQSVDGVVSRQKLFSNSWPITRSVMLPSFTCLTYVFITYGRHRNNEWSRVGGKEKLPLPTPSRNRCMNFAYKHHVKIKGGGGGGG